MGSRVSQDTSIRGGNEYPASPGRGVAWEGPTGRAWSLPNLKLLEGADSAHTTLTPAAAPHAGTAVPAVGGTGLGASTLVPDRLGAPLLAPLAVPAAAAAARDALPASPQSGGNSEHE